MGITVPPSHGVSCHPVWWIIILHDSWIFIEQQTLGSPRQAELRVQWGNQDHLQVLAASGAYGGCGLAVLFQWARPAGNSVQDVSHDHSLRGIGFLGPSTRLWFRWWTRNWQQHKNDCLTCLCMLEKIAKNLNETCCYDFNHRNTIKNNCKPSCLWQSRPTFCVNLIIYDFSTVEFEKYL